MLTQEDDVDAHALRKRGWKITANASRVSAPQRSRTASPGSSTTAVRGWSRIRICGR